MNKNIGLAAAALVGMQAVATNQMSANDGPSFLPGLIYHPEGDAIVVRNGERWDNRPLYCNAREMVVMAGEMPGLSCKLGKLRVGVKRGDLRLQLDQFGERVTRYRPGRMEWEARDPRLPGLAVMMIATTVANATHLLCRRNHRPRFSLARTAGRWSMAGNCAPALC